MTDARGETATNSGPECPHGEPRGPSGCALCRAAAYKAAGGSHPGVRPRNHRPGRHAPGDFWDLVQMHRARHLTENQPTLEIGDPQP